MWIEFGSDGLLYATVRTNSTPLDHTLVRFNGVTGATVDTFNIGRDSWSFQIGPDGLVYLSGNGGVNFVERLGSSSLAAFTVSLNTPSATPASVHYSTASGTAGAGTDFVDVAGDVTFAPGQTLRTILVSTIDNAAIELNETFTINFGCGRWQHCG